MHMADALLSPGTGITLWIASGTALALASRRLREGADDRLVPLMGMLGAFVFAAQMINFTIPATGSSGHLGGGLLLAILLGPHAALVVIGSVLTVQALCFADGGLLALGANLFNLGVLPCCVVYPLIYRPLAGAAPSERRAALAAIVAATIGVQLGALGVVLQTTLSGISSLPLKTFLMLMLPIHLAIGVVEGLATAAIVAFLRRARPTLLDRATAGAPARGPSMRPLVTSVALAALLTGGVLSWFASTQPDGLEWSVAHVAGTESLPVPAQGLHARLARLQQHLAWLPGYGTIPAAPASARGPAAWPDVKPATSLAGVVGGGVTLALVLTVGFGLRRHRPRA
ncbi:MAG TPA: energy-coupling factor ABC transporter permease [Caldimonas sp.]